MSEITNELIADAGDRMKKSVESTRHEFGTVRTGRASTGLLDRIVVDYYGAPTPLKQMATISAPEARLLTVQPYDRGSIKAIEILCKNQLIMSTNRSSLPMACST